jgi:hypothetical protein
VIFVLRYCLSLEDELGRPREDRAEEFLRFRIDHAAAFGKKKGRDGVGIHESVTGVTFVEQSVAALALEDVAETAFEIRGEFTVARHVSGRKVGHPDEGDDADRASVGVIEGTVGGLVRGEVAQGPVDGGLDRGLMFLKDLFSRSHPGESLLRA